MLKSKALTLQIAGTFALATLIGTSAFAESRHLGGTRGGGSSHSSHGRISVRAPRYDSRGSSGRGFSGRGSSGRGFSGRGSGESRFGGTRDVAAPRFGGRAPSDFNRVSPYRGGGRGPYNGGGNYYNNGSRFYGRGRIDRIAPYRGGYRVWLGGWGYPFFVPYRFYDPFRFRLGLFVGFNAFYDPLGYYSVYGWPGYAYPPVYSGSTYYRDDYNYNDNYNRNDNYDESVLRGTVESIDLHNGTVLINDESSRRVVTALLPPRDRRVDDIRPGDFVEFSGGWTRRGQFDADRMDRFEPRR
jgi:hypothetical protein